MGVTSQENIVSYCYVLGILDIQVNPIASLPQAVMRPLEVVKQVLHTLPRLDAAGDDLLGRQREAKPARVTQLNGPRELTRNQLAR